MYPPSIHPIRFFNSPQELQLLKPPQIHLLLQQRNNIRIKRLPIRITQMILLRRLLKVSLDDSKILLVVHGLHDEPGEGFLVL